MIRAGPPIILHFFASLLKTLLIPSDLKPPSFYSVTGGLTTGARMLWRPITWRTSGEGSTFAAGLQH